MTLEIRPRAERGVLPPGCETFGRSVLGAPLRVWPAAEGGTGTLVVAGVHGDEGESVAVLSAALRSIPEPALACDVVVALNPDGLQSGTRGNANGVDLNRNFPAANWSPDPVHYRWTLEEPRDVVLSPGSAPLSEPEARAFVDLAARLRPRLLLTIHAPLGCLDDPAKSALGAWIAERTGLERVPDVGYPTPGSMGSWGADRELDVLTWEFPREPTEHLVRTYAPVLAEVLAGRVP